MPYGNRIKAYREAAGLKQSDIANAVGVSSQAVSKWETNKSEPDSEAIRKMCEIFKVSADNLLGLNNDYPNIPNDDEIKFALFGVDPANITDAQFEEVKRFAQYIRDLQLKQDKK